MLIYFIILIYAHKNMTHLGQNGAILENIIINNYFIKHVLKSYMVIKTNHSIFLSYFSLLLRCKLFSYDK